MSTFIIGREEEKEGGMAGKIIKLGRGYHK
jgi:hypothetical protein